MDHVGIDVHKGASQICMERSQHQSVVNINGSSGNVWHRDVLIGQCPFQAEPRAWCPSSRTSIRHLSRASDSLRSAAVKDLRPLRALRSLRESLCSPLTAVSLRLSRRYGEQVDLPAECQRAGAPLPSGGPDGRQRQWGDGKKHPSVVRPAEVRPSWQSSGGLAGAGSHWCPRTRASDVPGAASRSGMGSHVGGAGCGISTSAAATWKCAYRCTASGVVRAAGRRCPSRWRGGTLGVRDAWRSTSSG